MKSDPAPFLWKSRRGIAVLVTAAVLAACSGRAEQAVLDRFFEAARLRDRTMLRAMATVSFEPHEQGIIRTFSIVRVGEEERRPMNPRSADALIVALSVPNVSISSEPSAQAPDIATKEVQITAPVAEAGGGTTNKSLTLILQRAIFGGKAAATGQWIVTGVVVRGLDR